MKQLIETLDLALEALENCTTWHLTREQFDKNVTAITAIKQARSAPVQEPDFIARLKHPEDHYEFTDPKKANAVLMSLCQEAADALAAPVQEPVIKQGWDVDTLLDKPAAPYVASPLVQDNDAHYKGVIEGVQKLFNDKRLQPVPVRDLPFGVGGGLVAIKTLLSRDPCVHANTAIEMIDAILKEHSAAQRQWVGLTDEDIEQEFGFIDELLRDCVHRTEAKLKEKNT